MESTMFFQVLGQRFLKLKRNLGVWPIWFGILLDLEVGFRVEDCLPMHNLKFGEGYYPRPYPKPQTLNRERRFGPSPFRVSGPTENFKA